MAPYRRITHSPDGNPDKYLYMKQHVIPELQDMGVSPATIEMLLVENPRRFPGGSAAQHKRKER